MTDERNDPLAGVRGALHVVRTLDGRPQIRGNITRAEREAVGAAIDAELAALRTRFAFDPEADVVRVLDLIAVVTTDDGHEVIVDPLSLLVPFLATVPDDPLGRPH